MQPRPRRVEPWLPWIGGALLAAWCFVIVFVVARTAFVGRFDDGIEYSTVTYLLHGQLPYTDFYEPYGIGLGIPGVLPHLLGIDGAFALRLVYGVFPAIVTLLATALVWKRCGALAGVLVGLVTLVSTTPRYSMGFAALFGFALIVDRAVRATPSGTLQEAAERNPRLLLVASAVCSLAGWARTEYAVFAIIWALVLVLVLPRGRRRWTLSVATIFLAALPTLIVLASGGLRGLWWFASYTLSPSPSGFHAQRGQPIEWHLIGDRLSDLLRLQLGASTPGMIVASYGVGLAVVAAALIMLLVPAWRRRLLTRDKSYLAPFMVVVCAVVLYGQAARFSVPYGVIGTPVFWVAAALLVERPARWALVAVLALVAYPLLPGVAPGSVYDQWTSRPQTGNRVAVPGLNRIPIVEDGGAPSMAALVAQWHALGLNGKSTFSVDLHNDVDWANDAIVGFLLNAPAAAWPLTFDPGLFNSAKVERAAVKELCADRAPVVQTTAAYTYPPGVKPYVGSRLLDEFLASNYEIRAVAGFYRILLPSKPHCVLPQDIDDATLEAAGERWLGEGELPAAGALAVARLERAEAMHEPLKPADAALAELGGYALKPHELPAGALGGALAALTSSTPVSGLARAAAQPWPSDIERLAAQTAWIAHRSASEAGTAQATDAVRELALRHADWPQAIANLSAIGTPSPALFARLARAGAAASAGLDRWRRDYYAQSGDAAEAIRAGAALVADYARRNDPVEAGGAELELATYPGVTPGCALLLRRDAGRRPGIRALVPAGGPACSQAELVDLVHSRSVAQPPR